MTVSRSSTDIMPYSYGTDDIGAGFDNQTSRDYTIPFMVLCQSQTPMVLDESSPARAGDWFNTVTEEVYTRDDGFIFVPALTKHVYAKWQPRNKGGSFRGHLEITDPKVQEAIENSKTFGKYEINEMTDDGPERLELRETFYVYGIVSDNDGNIRSMGAALPFWSTKVRVYKTWMTRLRQFPNAPIYAHSTRFTSKQEHNDQVTFYVPVAKSADPRGIVASMLAPDDMRFLAAKALRNSILAGTAKADYSAQVVESSEDIPF